VYQAVVAVLLLGSPFFWVETASIVIDQLDAVAVKVIKIVC
jgi:hypothetical protein